MSVEKTCMIIFLIRLTKNNLAKKKVKMSRSSRDFDSCESSQVTMRNHAPDQNLEVPGPKEKKGKRGKKGNRILTKADISGPQNFKHIGEIVHEPAVVHG